MTREDILYRYCYCAIFCRRRLVLSSEQVSLDSRHAPDVQGPIVSPQMTKVIVCGPFTVISKPIFVT